MDTPRSIASSSRSPSNPLQQFISSPAPAQPVSSAPSTDHRHSQSPFRYVRELPGQTRSDPAVMSEKVEETQLSEMPLGQGPRTPANYHQHHHPRGMKTPTTATYSSSSSSPSRFESRSSLSASRSQQSTPHPHLQPSAFPRSPHIAPLLLVPTTSGFSAPLSSTYTRPRGLRITNLIKPWLPLILYISTSLAFVLALSFWKAEVFQSLDELSHWLQTDEYFGYAVLFFLIFLTTFPPVPLYSTFIILSGYTFGPWTGAIISYFAALTGGITVFVLSRTFLRACISRWLSRTVAIKRVVRAIEKRPKLLFLIRLAPYPYNVMNCLLAASPTLTFRTYVICTAASLFKVIIHTSIGASIHSFAEYHLHEDAPAVGEKQEEQDSLSRISTIVGVVLCVAILVYLSYVARKAVDEELDEDVPSGDDEERTAFLSASDLEGGHLGQPMEESPFRAHSPVSAWNTSAEHSYPREEHRDDSRFIGGGETIGLY